MGGFAKGHFRAVVYWEMGMTIKTWQQRCEEHPAHDGIVTNEMIRERMQEEIDELRLENETLWKHNDELQGTESLRQLALQRLSAELQSAKSFHDVAIKERDFERRRNEALAQRLDAAVKQVAFIEDKLAQACDVIDQFKVLGQ